MTSTMTSIEDRWEELRSANEYGGSKLVSPSLPVDLYASLDAAGNVGIVLVSSQPVPLSGNFDSLAFSSTQRGDGRYANSLFLKASRLEGTFSLLCNAIIKACSAYRNASPEAIMGRQVAEWQELLEATSAGLTGSRLRGFIAELLVLQDCLRLWPARTLLEAWVGPLGAPQDFVLPRALIEVKATTPSSTTLRISSAEQLTDVTGTSIFLASVVLAQTNSAHPGAFSPPDLIADITSALQDHVTEDAFYSRLAVVGYSEDDLKARYFRSESPRYYAVDGPFPRITAADLPPGVSAVTYDVDIASCVEHEVSLEHINGL